MNAIHCNLRQLLTIDAMPTRSIIGQVGQPWARITHSQLLILC